MNETILWEEELRGEANLVSGARTRHGIALD